MNTRDKEINRRIDAAIEIAEIYGPYDGAHHKDWVIHQMIKQLCNYSDEELREWSESMGFDNIGIPP